MKKHRFGFRDDKLKKNKHKTSTISVYQRWFCYEIKFNLESKELSWLFSAVWSLI